MRSRLIACVTVLVLMLMPVWREPIAAAQAPPPQTVPSQDSMHELVLYDAPVTTHVIDPFRPPETFAGAGNRGLEYGDTDNQVVAAAAPGSVTFAGPVAGRQAITIEHADGVRTTYTGLLEVWVVSGGYVSRGSAIALASTGFHFGARVADHYLDPQVLLDASQGSVRARLLPPPGS